MEVYCVQVNVPSAAGKVFLSDLGDFYWVYQTVLNSLLNERAQRDVLESVFCRHLLHQLPQLVPHIGLQLQQWVH